jgi:hypothetical protein
VVGHCLACDAPKVFISYKSISAVAHEELMALQRRLLLDRLEIKILRDRVNDVGVSHARRNRQLGAGTLDHWRNQRLETLTQAERSEDRGGPSASSGSMRAIR